MCLVTVMKTFLHQIKVEVLTVQNCLFILLDYIKKEEEQEEQE